MENADHLLTIAEIGAAFAGFTGLIGALSQRPGRIAHNPTLKLTFWVMFEFSVAVIFFALIPLALLHFLDAHLTWATASGLMAVFTIVHMLMVGRPFILPEARAGNFPWSCVVASMALLIAVLVVQLGNAANLGFDRTFGPYFIGFLLFIGLATLNFGILLATLWRTAAEDE